METKTKQILEPSLETLHKETRGWLDTVHFYFDELTFLNDLVKNKIGSSSYEGQERKDLYRNVDNMLEKLSQEMVSELTEHEAYLSNLLDLKKYTNDAEYRSRHKTISKKLDALEQGLRNLKKSIFRYFRENAMG